MQIDIHEIFLLFLIFISFFLCQIFIQLVFLKIDLLERFITKLANLLSYFLRNLGTYNVSYLETLNTQLN